MGLLLDLEAGASDSCGFSADGPSIFASAAVPCRGPTPSQVKRGVVTRLLRKHAELVRPRHTEPDSTAAGPRK